MFFLTSLRMLSDVKFCHKDVIKPVLVQNCQFWNFPTALGKCQLLIAPSHSASLGPAGRWLLEPSRRCYAFVWTSLRMPSDVKFRHKNVIKHFLIQNWQFRNFLTALGKCPLLIALSHVMAGRPAGCRLPKPIRRCSVFLNFAQNAFRRQILL